MASTQEQDAWILKHFQIDVTKYEMKGRSLERQGEIDEFQGTRTFVQGKELINRADGQHRQAHNSNLPKANQLKAAQNAADLATSGTRLEARGSEQFQKGANEVEQGRQTLELVDVAKKSFAAAQRGGVEIGMLSLSVAAYCGGALSGGFVMVRITSANNPNIPDIDFTMPIDKKGLARWRKPLVLSPVGKVSFNIAPPAWLAKMLPGGELNHAPFFYEVKKKENFLSFTAVQGKTPISKSTGTTRTKSTTKIKGKSSSNGGESGGGLNAEAQAGVTWPVEGTIKLAPHLDKTNWQKLSREEKQKLTSRSEDQHAITNYVGPLFDLTISQDHQSG